MNKFWFNQSLSEAVDEPRVHTQLVGEEDGKLAPDNNVYIEKKSKYQLRNNIVFRLRHLGHQVEVGGDAAFAVVQAVYRKPEKGIYAKSDPRKYGVPAGQ